MSSLSYPFDTTGIAPSNLIQNEVHVLTEMNSAPQRLIVPDFAPFYLDNFAVVFKDTVGTTIPLVEGVDYYFCMPFIGGTRSIGKLMYGGISIINSQFNGSVTLKYQTIGGEWVADKTFVLSRLAEMVYNPRLTVWDLVTDKTNQFPPINHDQNLDFVYGHGDLIDAMNQLASTISQPLSQYSELYDHLSDRNNPHQVTKAQVGLTNVADYPVATQAEAEAGTVNNRYMTPIRTKQAVQELVGDDLNTHITDTNNPHQTTKTQVGLGNVQDYGVASQAEAEAGTVSNKYMTPQRVKQAITSQVGSSLDNHAGDTNNPHAVTKAQVGLASVADYSIATKAEAEAGTLNTRYMTPVRVKEAITFQALGAVNTHAARTDNPHAVTKSQVGLGNVSDFGTATPSDAVSAIQNFADVFNTWTRYSHQTGQPQPAIPSELNNWEYNQLTDTLSCTINSISHIGFVSPVEYGDYDFQVELSSTNADDDIIGIVLGFETVAGKQHTLVATRVLNSATTFQVINDFLGEAPRGIANSNGGITNNTYINPGPGWSTVKFRMRAVRQGDIITVYTTLPNSTVYEEATKIVVDLNSNADLAKFKGSSKVGFCCQSQFGSTWKVLSSPWAREDKFMTPLAVKEAINANNSREVLPHIGNLNNPHQTTKTQVGLGNVQDYPVASKAEAEAGTATDRYMTPQRTKEAVSSQVGSSLTNHINNVSNPHGVTAAQVGSYTKTETDTLLNGKLGTTAQAADSAKLSGNTLTQVLNSAYAAVGTMGKRNVYIENRAPLGSEGAVGDIWLQY